MIADPVAEAVRPFFAIRTVIGVFLAQDDRVLFDSLPERPGLGEDLARVLGEMFDGYASVGRKSAETCFLFSDAWLYATSLNGCRFALLTRQSAEMEELHLICRHVVRVLQPDKTPLPRVPTRAARARLYQWAEYEGHLTAVLAESLLPAQARQMIHQEIADRRIGRTGSVSAHQLFAFTEGILSQIPSKTARDHLRIAVESLLREFVA